MSKVVQLDPASVEAVARRVLELIRAEHALGAPAGELLTAAQVSRRHRVDRSWVYAHAAELGALRLGDGPKPRLRFDPERVRRALSATPANEESGVRVRPRAVDIAALVPDSLEALPERWRAAAGAPEGSDAAA